MPSVLSINGITKYYGKRKVLNNLSLEVEEGSVFGLLGPNGSGKTTTLGIVLDILPKNEGSYQWFGQVPDHHQRKKIGAVLESPNFYGYLSANDNLKIVADIKQVPYRDIERVLDFVKLADRKKDTFATYSLGMKQRLALASALLGQPKVLVLDEPTNGLDPQGISEIRQLISEISLQGTTIILASHLLDEVEKVCSDVAIIKEGNLLFSGKVDQIGKGDNLLMVGAEDRDRLLQLLEMNPNVLKIKTQMGLFELTLGQDYLSSDLNQYLHTNGLVLNHLAAKKKNLEMQFLEITN